MFDEFKSNMSQLLEKENVDDYEEDKMSINERDKVW